MGTATSTAALQVPNTQKAFYIVKRDSNVKNIVTEIRDVPIPQPRNGEVLVQMKAAVVNPSDYGNWINEPKPTDNPQIPGKEGSGVVVKSGGGFYANSLVGKNVGVVLPKSGGTYQEYVVVNASLTSLGAMPLPLDINVIDAASHFVNPYTAVGFLDTVKSAYNAKKTQTIGFIHTAACSQLGQMLVKLSLRENFKIINLVNKNEQVELLENLGAKYIINTSEVGWEQNLKDLMKELNINIVFDAVSGSMSGKLLSILPNGGTLYAYGILGGPTCDNINFLDLSYFSKKFEGWFLTNWLNQHGKSFSTLSRINSATALVHRGLNGGWSSSKFMDCKLNDFWKTFLDMKLNSGFTNKKIRILF